MTSVRINKTISEISTRNSYLRSLVVSERTHRHTSKVEAEIRRNLAVYAVYMYIIRKIVRMRKPDTS